MNNNYRNKNRKRKAIIFITTILFLISLIVTSNDNNLIISLGGNIIGTITTPITKVVYVTSSKIIDGIEFIFGSANMRKENARLNAENIALREQVANMEKVINSSDYLELEYELIKNSDKKLLKSYIVGLDTSNIYDRFTIDKGKVQGVKVNDTVVQGVIGQNNTVIKGLIGTVTEVGPNYSKVTSITDASTGVSFRNSRTGEIGVVSGGKNNIIEGYMYNTGADIAVGDSVYTSGLGGIYPPEIYIGKIKEIMTDDNKFKIKVIIESPVDFRNIYRVLIITNEWKTDNE